MDLIRKFMFGGKEDRDGSVDAEGDTANFLRKNRWNGKCTNMSPLVRLPFPPAAFLGLGTLIPELETYSTRE